MRRAAIVLVFCVGAAAYACSSTYGTSDDSGDAGPGDASTPDAPAGDADGSADPCATDAGTWARGYAGDFRYSGFAFTDDGDMVVSGSISGTFSFGKTPLVAAAGDASGVATRDAVVARLAADGTERWAKSFGDSNDQGGPVLVVAPNGDIVLFGPNDGTIDLGCGSTIGPATARDSYVARFDANGRCLWQRPIVGDGQEYPAGAWFDATGTLWLAIQTYASDGVDWGLSTQATNTTSHATFVASFDDSGRPHDEWKRVSPALAYGARQPDGTISFTGYIEAPADFFGLSVSPPNAPTVFAGLVGQDLKAIWHHFFPFYPSGASLSMLPISASRYQLIVNGGRGADVGQGNVPPMSFEHDIYLLTIEQDGGVSAAREYGVIGSSDVHGAARFDGGFYLAADITGTIDFGSGAIRTTHGRADILLTKFDDSLKVVPDSTQTFGDENDQNVAGLALDRCKAPVLLGTFVGTLDMSSIGIAPLKSNGPSAFIARLPR
jgi:hypothetical protein